MLLLEPSNRILSDLLTQCFTKYAFSSLPPALPCPALPSLTPSSSHRPTSLDQAFVDFDSVRFHLSTPTKKTLLLLSMHVRCWDELVQHGAGEIMQREYGAWLIAQGETESEYSVSLEIDLEKLPEGEGELLLALLGRGGAGRRPSGAEGHLTRSFLLGRDRT